jgi:hypothetical protein
MNWDAIGALGEVVGAIAVFITLVYLTLQIRQNTRSVKAAAVQAAMISASSTYSALAYDAEMSRIYWEGLSDFKSLPREERRRFATYMASTLKPTENLLVQTRLGTLDYDDWEGERNELVRHFSQPGTRTWWVKGEAAFGRELVDFIKSDILPKCGNPAT